MSYKKSEEFDTQLSTESQDSDRDKKKILKGKMVYYDFIECLYHLSQFSWAHLES